MSIGLGIFASGVLILAVYHTVSARLFSGPAESRSLSQF
jgi:hypothetical protein